jgi:hypothetical protein
MARTSTWLTRLVRNWLEAAEERETLRRCHGDQRCPWCRRWMNQSTYTFTCPFDFATAAPTLDEFICGHCGGTSLWKWEIGFIYVMRADPPPAPPCGFGDSEFIQHVIAEAKADLEERGGFFSAESSASVPSAASAGNPARDEPSPTPKEGET